MSWNGAGIFERLYSWVADRDLGIKILAQRMDNEFDNYKGGLENCLTRDGQTPPTANVPFGGFKATGLAAATAPTDAVILSQLSAQTQGLNYLINPNFYRWQRYAYDGATAVVGTAGLYTADRWYAWRTGGVTDFTITQDDTAASSGVSPYQIKLQRDSGTSSTADISLGQSLDALDVQSLYWNGLASANASAGDYLIFSCYIKKGANFSSTTGVSLEILYSPDAEQNIASGTNWAQAALATVAPASLSAVTYTRCSVALAGPTAIATLFGALSIGVRVVIDDPVGAAGADDSITIQGAKLEVSGTSEATDYREPVQIEEDMRIFRYCQRSFPMADPPAQASGSDAGSFQFLATGAGAVVARSTPRPFSPVMRDQPTMTTYNPVNANALPHDVQAGADCSGIAVTATPTQLSIVTTGDATSAAGNILAVHWLADAEF